MLGVFIDGWAMFRKYERTSVRTVVGADQSRDQCVVRSPVFEGGHTITKKPQRVSETWSQKSVTVAVVLSYLGPVREEFIVTGTRAEIRHW